MSTAEKTSWILERVGVVPRSFLSAEGTWGGAATAQKFGTEEEAWLYGCPPDSTGVATRMNYLSRRMGDDLPVLPG